MKRQMKSKEKVRVRVRRQQRGGLFGYGEDDDNEIDPKTTLDHRSLSVEESLLFELFKKDDYVNELNEMFTKYAKSIQENVSKLTQETLLNQNKDLQPFVSDINERNKHIKTIVESLFPYVEIPDDIVQNIRNDYTITLNNHISQINNMTSLTRYLTYEKLNDAKKKETLFEKIKDDIKKDGIFNSIFMTRVFKYMYDNNSDKLNKLFLPTILEHRAEEKIGNQVISPERKIIVPNKKTYNMIYNVLNGLKQYEGLVASLDIRGYGRSFLGNLYSDFKSIYQDEASLSLYIKCVNARIRFIYPKTIQDGMFRLYSEQTQMIIKKKDTDYEIQNILNKHEKQPVLFLYEWNGKQYNFVYAYAIGDNGKTDYIPSREIEQQLKHTEYNERERQMVFNRIRLCKNILQDALKDKGKGLNLLIGRVLIKKIRTFMDDYYTSFIIPILKDKNSFPKGHVSLKLKDILSETILTYYDSNINEWTDPVYDFYRKFVSSPDTNKAFEIMGENIATQKMEAYKQTKIAQETQRIHLEEDKVKRTISPTATATDTSTPASTSEVNIDNLIKEVIQKRNDLKKEAINLEKQIQDVNKKLAMASGSDLKNLRDEVDKLKKQVDENVKNNEKANKRLLELRDRQKQAKEKLDASQKQLNDVKTTKSMLLDTAKGIIDSIEDTEFIMKAYANTTSKTIPKNVAFQGIPVIPGGRIKHLKK